MFTQEDDEEDKEVEAEPKVEETTPPESVKVEPTVSLIMYSTKVIVSL